MSESFPKRQLRQIGEVITAVRDGLGTPHLHSGLGIRRLRSGLFACRVGLHLLLIFDAEAGALTFSDFGSHDDIRRIIRNR